MAWCAFTFTNSTYIQLIASAIVLIERGTLKPWKLDGAYALDPVRRKTQLFLSHWCIISHYLIFFRGCSAVSPNQKLLAMTNLYDGIDWYSLDSNHFMGTPFQNTTPHTILENVILPVVFIHNGTAVLSGASTGCAWITGVKDHSLVELLQHDCK